MIVRSARRKVSETKLLRHVIQKWRKTPLWSKSNMGSTESALRACSGQGEGGGSSHLATQPPSHPATWPPSQNIVLGLHFACSQDHMTMMMCRTQKCFSTENFFFNTTIFVLRKFEFKILGCVQKFWC